MENTATFKSFKYDNNVKKIPIDAKEINKEIAKVSETATMQAPLIHACLFAAAAHAEKHKDGSLVTNLWNSLPNSINKKNGIGAWLNKYTSLRLTTDKAGVSKWLGKDKVYTLVIEAEFIAFYNMPEVEKLNSQAPMDVFEAFMSFVKRMDKALEEKKAVGATTAKVKTFVTEVHKLAKEYEPVKKEAPKASTPVAPRKQGTRPANENVKVQPVAA